MLGFDVRRRSVGRSGRFAKLNRALMIARTGGASGASYRFVDGGAAAGKTYVYRLELVGLDGRRTVAATVRAR